MERLEEYKRLKDDQLRGKSKSKAPSVERKDRTFIMTIKGTRIALGSRYSAIASW